MAWHIGESITASKLGNENYNNYGYFEGTLPDSSDWIENYIGNNGQVYSHVAAGTTLFWALPLWIVRRREAACEEVGQ